MAEWLYEEGIGETRAALVHKGEILEACIERDGKRAMAGAIVQGRLVRTIIPKRRGIVRLDSGEDALLEPIPPKLAEGATLLAEILRERIAEEGRDKLAKVRIAPPGSKTQSGPTLYQRISATDIPVVLCPAHEPDRLEDHGWSELMEQAMTGEVGTETVSLRLFLTPAMTLIDVDGSLLPAQLGPQGAALAAKVIRRMGITGSIGIDLPTMNNKDERLLAATLFDKHLPLPFERTAVNGFGFLQVIRRRERPSLMEIVQDDPVKTAALALLRRGERHGTGGAVTLTAASAVIDRLAKAKDWIAQLERRRGGPVTLRHDDSFGIASFHAE
ncbi:ribonuclease [Rhizorhapis sp. SPR117]|uniref:ribonuclease n=1 Tax=Rhizorhapis sp. SPR117 TaxID=2912611 RepID=UPI001F3675C0|nr:ribonuclease [Rhizorhapis sp. SPR117]